MIAGMAILAAACVVLGVLASLGISLISLAFHLPLQPSGPLDTITLQNNAKNTVHLSMSVVLILLVTIAVGAFGFIRTIGGKTSKTVYGTWDCGFGNLSERMEYTATSLSQPIRAVFKVFFKPHNVTDKEFFVPTNQYLIKSIKFNSKTKNIFEENLYHPIISSTLRIFDKIRKIQTGKINSYLLYIMITAVLLLLFVRLSH
jgi:hydrogenase-4 component B